MATTAEQLLSAATTLFAKRGYEGTSVRDICKAAGANVNAVSYHFGGKLALYQQIIQRLGDERLAGAQRILGTAPKDAADFETRLLLYAQETLAAYMADPEPLVILMAEYRQGFRNCDETAVGNLTQKTEVLITFLKAARRRKLLRKGVDPDIIAGSLQERLINQVLHAEVIQASYGRSLKDPAYMRHWTQQIIDLMLFGISRRDADP